MEKLRTMTCFNTSQYNRGGIEGTVNNLFIQQQIVKKRNNWVNWEQWYSSMEDCEAKHVLEQTLYHVIPKSNTAKKRSGWRKL